MKNSKLSDLESSGGVSKNHAVISRTKDIPCPNAYVKALGAEYADWAYNEEESVKFIGAWKSDVFKNNKPIDLEIGTGNGFYFAHYAERYPERNLIGIERKYKPLIQSVRRALKAGCQNIRMLRYNAKALGDLFEKGELDRVIIHFPDPWKGKKSRKKNRLLSRSFFEMLWMLQKVGGVVEIKTDCRDYFESILEEIQETSYQILEKNFDLHRKVMKNERSLDELSSGKCVGGAKISDNFVTGFERIFMRQGLAIHYLLLQKNL